MTFAQRIAILTVVVVLLSGLVTGAGADNLRGFGEITGAPLSVGGLTGASFTCENADKALVFMHKLGRDLEQSSTVAVSWPVVKVGDASVPVLVRPGLGSFLLATVGAKVIVLTSPQTERLEAALAPAAGQIAGGKFFDASFRYPVYLDKFDHYGIGSWYPQYWGDDNTKGHPNSVDDHFAFAKEMGLTIQPNGGGHLLANLLPKIHEYDRPYHFAQWLEWSSDLARMCPEDLTQPGPLFDVMPNYYGQVSMGGKKLLTLRNYDFQQAVKAHVDDPLLVDWLDPNGEVGPWDIHYYWDFSENQRRHLVDYLRNQRHYTPASLGQAWYGDAGRYHSWDQVPIPMSYDFFGWETDSLQADKLWRAHSGTLPVGLTNGYQKDACDDSKWPAFTMPGGELPAIMWRTTKQQWYRGTLQVPAAWLTAHRARGRIYLEAATFSSANGWQNSDHMWVNGQEMGAIYDYTGSTVGQVDVTNLLRPGVNTISYLEANPWAGPSGPFFLTSKVREFYPYADPHLNARYYDWHTYVSWCVADKMENTYKAIRAVDPNRFIKMMAAEDKELGIPLQAKYGGYGHNTGEGGFFRPWDKRFGYPRGVPGSAEFGGGPLCDTAFGITRWVGWFTFEGDNAFDNFHNIQEMMYSAAHDTWVKYMPYLKLANRRDIKKPDIALLWSSFNCNTLSRPVPYCFDLGRGDLQSIGYSYVDMDEVGIADGLAKDYPVLWDTGTQLMSKETVAQIKAYVEAGGTYVALEETGRGTFTDRDAWPITDLTGFRVHQIRPMEGTLTILNDQPLFTKLAGKTFFNRGKSIDYMNVNYADKCVALDPIAPDTQAIARYEDGSIAIGLRQLGKGRVVVLGSPFWRDSYDGDGMWWPGEGQSLFLEDLLHGLGLKPLATCDSHDIWREHYVADNGTEEYLAMWNPFPTERTFSVDWTTVNPAQGLYDPKTGRAVPGTVTGNDVHLEKVTLQPLETLIVATQSARAPQAAVDDWYKHLVWWWRPSAPGTMLTRPDLPVYDLQLGDKLAAKYVKTADLAGLNPLALSAGGDPGTGWTRGAGQSVEELRSHPDPNRRVVFRCAIPMPADYKLGDDYILALRGFSYPGTAKKVDAYLNGVQVMDQVPSAAKGYEDLEGGAVADVKSALQFGTPNILVIVTDQNGFQGQVVLSRKPAPAERLEIKGPWQVQIDENSGTQTVTLPGLMKGLYATKEDVVVPAAWQGSRVFIEVSLAEPADYDGFAINGKVVFHPINWFKPVRFMDITPWVKLGQKNTLVLMTHSATQKWEPGSLTVQSVVLERVPVKGL